MPRELPHVIVENCVSALEELLGSVITEDMLTDYGEAVRRNLHGILQYALIKAGLQAGALAIPEYKIQLKKPLDPSEYGLSGRRKMHVYRADVGFLLVTNGPWPVGFGEAFTLDTAHSCCKPLEVEEVRWVTSGVKIPHVLRYGEFAPGATPFTIIVAVLPTSARRTPSWRDQRRLLASSTNYYEVFAPR